MRRNPSKRLQNRTNRHLTVGIMDGQAWRVAENYKENYLRHLKPGHTARVWLDAHPWRLYRARIQGVTVKDRFAPTPAVASGQP